MTITINDFFQRHKSFLNIQRFESNKTSLNFIQDVNTRWNNIFLMMKRAFALKMNVINWLSREFSNLDQKRRTREIFKKLMMIEIEWKEAKYMMNFLRSFYQWTQKIDQSRDLIIQLAFTVYNSLFDHLENQKKKCVIANVSWSKNLKTTIYLTRNKLFIYYERIDEKRETLYNLETILNSTQKTITYKICFFTNFSHRFFTMKYVIVL